MASVPTRILENGLLRLMDTQNATYPDLIPQGSEEDLPVHSHDNFPLLLYRDIGAMAKWTPAYLEQQIGSQVIEVAHTPLGNADAPIGDLFVRPFTKDLTVADFLHSLHDTDMVRYLQSQDNNFHHSSAFEAILADSQLSIEAGDRLWGAPEAVNLWIGDSRTTSRLHNDNYENLFWQIQGYKRITLFPPHDLHALKERFLTLSDYQLNGDSFDIQTSEDKVLFPTVDPSDPVLADPDIYSHTHPFVVELGPGDMLYIPALWYHQVQVLSDLSISINYWYPASERRALWASWDHLRYTSLALRGEHNDFYFD